MPECRKMARMKRYHWSAVEPAKPDRPHDFSRQLTWGNGVKVVLVIPAWALYVKQDTHGMQARLSVPL